MTGFTHQVAPVSVRGGFAYAGIVASDNKWPTAAFEQSGRSKRKVNLVFPPMTEFGSSATAMWVLGVSTSYVPSPAIELEWQMVRTTVLGAYAKALGKTGRALLVSFAGDAVTLQMDQATPISIPASFPEKSDLKPWKIMVAAEDVFSAIKALDQLEYIKTISVRGDANGVLELKAIRLGVGTFQFFIPQATKTGSKLNRQTTGLVRISRANYLPAA